jgi:NAD+ synthase (glutamine-hydrolysing)
MKITIAQINPVVGDIEGNLRKIFSACESGALEKSDLVVFPEMALCGYPPRDLVERDWFVDAIEKGLKKIQTFSKKLSGTGILVGAVVRTGRTVGKQLYNSAVLFYRGKKVFQQNKSLLPTYDVFDEARHFEPSADVNTVSFKGKKLGITICEDAWNAPSGPFKKLYKMNPVDILARKGADVIINISASPYQMDKEKLRLEIFSYHARKYGRPFIFVNQVGANDELIFDGTSMAADEKGKVVFSCPSFEEKIVTIDMKAGGRRSGYAPLDKVEAVHNALCLGISDYVKKCGFKKVVLGLSGGIDSAVVCCLAADALGAENVMGVTMPSPYSSKGSIEDSRELAKNLGVDFKVIPISGVFSCYLKGMEEEFRGYEPNIAEENIQARIRGNILMALSNKFGYLVLSTGNKSEVSVGYCTLYGDMSGGLSVISDVYKTFVYKLAKYINRKREMIPEAIITKVPSAELRPDQTDQDTLPPYPVLDKILYYYIDEKISPEKIIRKGFDRKTVEWVVRTVDRSEYKRRQAAPGLKITFKAFGIGRRMPIAAKY